VNESRDIHQLTQAYGLINENEDNRVWKTGDCPDSLGDSDLANELKPDNNLPEEDSVPPIEPSDESDYYLNKISERIKENGKKPGKKVNEQINNSTNIMSDEPKNIFDKLYSTIMEGDDPFADLDSMGDEGPGDEMGSDEELDLGGDEVTFSLPRDLAEKLHEVLMDQLGDDSEGDDGEDFGDDFGDENDEMLGDSVVSEPDPKPLGGHGDRHHKDAGNTGSGSNKVSSSKTSSPDGGSADGGTVKEDPDPKPLGGHGDRQHKDAGNTGSGSNKVNNPKSRAIGD
jgi:hypothetical protein